MPENDDHIIVERSALYSPNSQAGYQQSGSGLMVPAESGLTSDTPEGYIRTDHGILLPEKMAGSPPEGIIRDEAAENKILLAQHEQQEHRNKIYIEPGKISISIAALRGPLGEVLGTTDEVTEVVISALVGSTDAVISLSPYATERKKTSVKTANEYEKTAPGPVENVLFACAKVIDSLSENVSAASQKDMATVLEHMHHVLTQVTINSKNINLPLPEFPDFTDTLMMTLDRLMHFPQARKLVYDVFEQVSLSKSQKEQVMRRMDYFNDLHHPLAFKITTQLLEEDQESVWIVEQKQRIEHVRNMLEATPQDIVDSFPRLAELSRKIVFVGPPFVPISGKAGFEVEFGYGSSRETDGSLDWPEFIPTYPIPKGFEDHREFLEQGSNDVFHWEVIRSTSEDPLDKELEFNESYVRDLVQLREWLRGSGAGHIAGFHLHLDNLRHPYAPNMAGLLGNEETSTVVKDKRGRPTHEIRGLLAPMGSDTSLDPALLTDIVALYTEASKEPQLREGTIQLYKDREYAKEALIMGHIANVVKDPAARLAALCILERGRYLTWLAEKNGGVHIPALSAVDPLAIAGSYTLESGGVVFDTFISDPLASQSDYIRKKLDVLQLLNLKVPYEDWGEIKLQSLLETYMKEPRAYASEVVRLVTEYATDNIWSVVRWLQENNQLEDQLSTLLASPDKRVQASLVWSLNPSEPSNLEALKTLADSSFREVRRDALERMLMGGEREREAGLNLLKTSPHEDVRVYILKIAEIDDLPVIGETLVNLYEHAENSDIRLYVIQLLALNEKDYRAVLQRATDDPAFWVAEYAIRALAKNEANVAFFKEKLATANEAKTLQILNNFAGNDVVSDELFTIARKFLDSPSDAIPLQALCILAKDIDKNIDDFKTALRSERSAMRVTAVEYLLEHGKKYKELWEPLLDSPDDIIRNRIQTYLELTHFTQE